MPTSARSTNSPGRRPPSRTAPRALASRRGVLRATGWASIAAVAVAPTAPAAAADYARPLVHRPFAVTRSPITIDLSQFDPTLPFPGWNGRAPSQRTNALYPQDRDLLILGHSRSIWTGGGYIRGGRTVHWIGGTYVRGPWLRNFTGDACMEGIAVRAPYSATGSETGDGPSLVPDSTTLGRSRIRLLNCRVENIDGYLDGMHGDCFQLPSSYDIGGYSSTPYSVVIERFTGTTGYQGFFLANQHFDSRGYRMSTRSLTLLDVNLRKTRARTATRSGLSATGRVWLFYFIDSNGDRRGDKPYPIKLTNVYAAPARGETLDDCIFPNSQTTAVNAFTGRTMQPTYVSGGAAAVYPSSLMITGSVQRGWPPGGDFAAAPTTAGRGGLGRPGIGYVSPGYLEQA